jgi:hypothetical protein
VNAPTIEEETQSFTLALRDAFMEAALRLPAFAGFYSRETKQLPTQTEDLPSLGVYLIDETMVPEGDGNAGNLSFVVTARIGFSMVIVNNDPRATETTLDRLYVSLMNGLWRDPYLTSFFDTWNPHLGHGTAMNARFEAIPRQMARRVYGALAASNETPIAEQQYEVSLLYRRDFEPAVEDELLEVDFKTAIGFPDHEQIQQIEMPIRFMRPKNGSAKHG